MDFIPSIEFIDERGWFHVNAFCCNMAEAFGIEGILDASPKPMEIRKLLIDELQKEYSLEEMKSFYGVQKVVGWRPEMQSMYPDGETETLHIAALLRVYDSWVFEIGQRTPGTTQGRQGQPYLKWAKKEWITVYTFIHAFHNQLVSFLKRVDHENMKENGVSSFEALHVAQTEGIKFDEATKLLKLRHKSYHDALVQIQAAIDQEFFLEAVTIEECVISNCLWNFAKYTSDTAPRSTTLHKLISATVQLANKAEENPIELLSQLDNWRKLRNTAIHGFVTADGMQFWNGRSGFTKSSKATATQGLELTSATVHWYENEAVNFIKTRSDAFDDADGTIH